MEVPSDLADDELVERATASPRVRSYLDGGKIRQTIVVPKKLVNFVTD
jgi:leucyl-tRNA synthetase